MGFVWQSNLLGCCRFRIQIFGKSSSVMARAWYLVDSRGRNWFKLAIQSLGLTSWTEPYWTWPVQDFWFSANQLKLSRKFDTLPYVFGRRRFQRSDPIPLWMRRPRCANCGCGIWFWCLGQLSHSKTLGFLFLTVGWGSTRSWGFGTFRSYKFIDGAWIYLVAGVRVADSEVWPDMQGAIYAWCQCRARYQRMLPKILLFSIPKGYLQ